MAGERLVHRVVDDLREQVMQRLLVGAADIHAGAAAHRLQPFQHLDVARRVGLAAAGAGLPRAALPDSRRAPRRRVGEQVAGSAVFFAVFAIVTLRMFGNESVVSRLCHGRGGIVTCWSLAWLGGKR